MEPALHAELLSFHSVVGPEADVIQMLSQAFTAALFAAVIDGVHARSSPGNLYGKEWASAVHPPVFPIMSINIKLLEMKLINPVWSLSWFTCPYSLSFNLEILLTSSRFYWQDGTTMLTRRQNEKKKHNWEDVICAFRLGFHFHTPAVCILLSRFYAAALT